jgi:hypothetical protein
MGPHIFKVFIHFVFLILGQILFWPAISVDGNAEFRVNFGTQPFHQPEMFYQVHGFGNSMRNPRGSEEEQDACARFEGIQPLRVPKPLR